MATTQKSRKPIKVKSRADGDAGLPQVASELSTLVVNYAKQEVRDPLKGLADELKYGLAAYLLMGLGSVLLAIGALRALQTQTGSTFTGSLSFLPYLIVLIGAGIVLGLYFWLLTKRKS